MVCDLVFIDPRRRLIGEMRAGVIEEAAALSLALRATQRQ